jgi:protein tyrosine/serine phosphatase
MLLNILLITISIALLVYRYRKLMYHFRTVEAGKLYRSGTLGPVALRVMHRVLGVNTIINLRLESEYNKGNWYQRQSHYCARHGIKLVNIPMAQDTPPTEAQIKVLMTELERSGSRCLVHCEMGVIRTGMMVVAVATRRYGVRDQAVWKHFPLFGHKLDGRRQSVKAFIQRCAGLSEPSPQ